MTTQIPSVPGRAPAPAPAGPEPGPGTDNRLRIALVIAVVLAILATVALVVVLARGGGDETAGPAATTAPAAGNTQPPAATTQPPAATTQPPAPTTVAPPVNVNTDTAVWPVKTSNVRYSDPVAAARGFAVDLVGFRSPIVGPFMQGDNRSGEVEIRPLANGPATTVFVRQLEDNTWWVLGAATARIQLESPSTGDLIGSPVRLVGTSQAFEGTITVTIREDGVAAPLASGFVTGGADEMGPFDDQIEFARAPTQRFGVLLLTEESAENGAPWQASVVRVQLRP